MRRISTLVAALAAAFAVGNASALVLVVDEFNSPDLKLFDVTGGDGLAATQNQNPTRFVSHEMLTTSALGQNSDGGFSAVRIGNQTIPAGLLQMGNLDTIDSQVKVSWTLNAGDVPLLTPTSFFFSVYNSDAVQKSVSFSVDGGATTFVSYNIGLASNVPLLFAVGGAEQAILNAGGTLTMVVDGDAGWDLSLDSFGFQIPEPTSIALVGLALLGAGVASRRRQA